MRQPTISALMCINHSDSATALAATLESLCSQTLPPDQLVLVVDGPVTQETVIARYQQDCRIAEKLVLRVPTQGLASALNTGLGVCTGEWIMLMDCGEQARRDRLAIQIGYLREKPELDMFASWGDTGDPQQVKSSPTTHDAVAVSLRWSNVVLYPTVLIRASVLRQIGGYRSMLGREDHDLWVRFVMSGARLHVIPAFLVRIRDTYRYRGGLRGVQFRFHCWRLGFLDLRQLFLGIAARFLVRSGEAITRVHQLYIAHLVSSSIEHRKAIQYGAKNGVGLRGRWLHRRSSSETVAARAYNQEEPYNPQSADAPARTHVLTWNLFGDNYDEDSFGSRRGRLYRRPSC